MQQVTEKIRLPVLPWKATVMLVTALVLVAWLINTPAGLLGKADAVAYAVCHRIESRSFFLGDRQIPLCARCSGMYLGAVLGLVYQQVRSPRRGGMPARRVWMPLAVLAAAFGLDGLNSYLHLFPGAPTLYEPGNTLRLLTGTGMGLGLSAVLFPVFNQVIWKNSDPRPALPGLSPLSGLLLLALVLDGIVLSENPMALYPLALVSAAGVVVLLTMVYAVLLVTLARAENRVARRAQLLLPLTGGFALALLQIAALDFARFLVTGTWEGFHFT